MEDLEDDESDTEEEKSDEEIIDGQMKDLEDYESEMEILEDDEKDNEEENNDVDKEFGEQESITRLYQGAKLTSTKNVLVADWLKVSSERTAVARTCEDL